MSAAIPFFSIAVTERQSDGSSETVSYIPLDVREKSTHSFSSQVSENPIESGSVVADHVIRDPVKITVSGLVSDTPVGQVSKSAQLQGDAGQVLPGTRAMGAYQALHQAWKKSSPLTVITELGVFDDMQITSLSFPRDRDRGGNAVWFDLELKEVEVVESRSASLPPDMVSKIKRRRAKTKAKLTPRKKEMQARKAEEVHAGKVSTSSYSDSSSRGYTSQNLAFTYSRL